MTQVKRNMETSKNKKMLGEKSPKQSICQVGPLYIYKCIKIGHEMHIHGTVSIHDIIDIICYIYIGYIVVCM